MEKSTASALVNAYAILDWIAALLLVVGALSALMFGSIVGGMMGGAFALVMPGMNEMMRSDAITAGGLFGIGVVVVIVVFAALATLHFLTGKALWRREPWGRIAQLVISAFSLLMFPLGTILGLVGIWLFGFDKTVNAQFGVQDQKPLRKASRRKKR